MYLRAQYFVAGTVRSVAFAEEDYGYLLEEIMLQLLDMGLGTCWLGGTFKRNELTWELPCLTSNSAAGRSGLKEIGK